MLLLLGEIEALEVNGRAYSIITNARFWINTIKTLKLAITEEEKAFILLQAVEIDLINTTPQIINRLLERITWFYTCEYEKCNNHKSKIKGNNNILYDFYTDGGRVYSAFYLTYGIDIESILDNMHWWKFMALFNDLSKESNLKGYYMHYRSYNKNSKEYKDASNDIRRMIDEQIQNVVINNSEPIIEKESLLENKRKKTRGNNK